MDYVLNHWQLLSATVGIIVLALLYRQGLWLSGHCGSRGPTGSRGCS